MDVAAIPLLAAASCDYGGTEFVDSEEQPFTPSLPVAGNADSGFSSVQADGESESQADSTAAIHVTSELEPSLLTRGEGSLWHALRLSSPAT